MQTKVKQVHLDQGNMDVLSTVKNTNANTIFFFVLQTYIVHLIVHSHYLCLYTYSLL